MNTLTLMHISLGIPCLISVCCRLNLMGKDTKHSITMVYFFLGCILAKSLFIHTNVYILIALSYTAFVLALDAPQWKDRQPNYTIDNEKRRLFL